MKPISNFDDVSAFHEKFGLPRYGDGRPPTPLTKDLVAFRGNFLIEELAEFFEGCGCQGVAKELRETGERVREARFAMFPVDADLAKAVDALVDLNYVSLGTAHFMAVPFDEHWTEVQRANVTKERATGADDPRSKRGHGADVVKPTGWEPPDHGPILERARITALTGDPAKDEQHDEMRMDR